MVLNLQTRVKVQSAHGVVDDTIERCAEWIEAQRPGELTVSLEAHPEIQVTVNPRRLFARVSLLQALARELREDAATYEDALRQVDALTPVALEIIEGIQQSAREAAETRVLGVCHQEEAQAYAERRDANYAIFKGAWSEHIGEAMEAAKLPPSEAARLIFWSAYEGHADEALERWQIELKDQDPEARRRVIEEWDAEMKRRRAAAPPKYTPWSELRDKKLTPEERAQIEANVKAEADRLRQEMAEAIAQVRTRLQGMGYADADLWTDDQLWERWTETDEPTSGAVADELADAAGWVYCFPDATFSPEGHRVGICRRDHDPRPNGEGIYIKNPTDAEYQVLRLMDERGLPRWTGAPRMREKSCSAAS